MSNNNVINDAIELTGDETLAVELIKLANELRNDYSDYTFKFKRKKYSR